MSTSAILAQASQESPAQRAMLARVAELTTEPLVITDHRGRIEYVNGAFTRSTGYTANEVLRESPARFIALMDDFDTVRGALDTLHSGKTWEGSLALRRKQGGTVALSARVSPYSADGEHTTHYLALSVDLTRERTLERQLSEMQRLEALGTLAAGVAHRFNNVLAAVSGQTELLQMMAEGIPELSARANKILAAVERGRHFVSQLSAFSRKEAAPLRPANLVEELRRAVQFAESVAPKGMRISAEIPDTFPPVLLASDDFQQVLLNLFTNSFQAMEGRRGHLRVSLAEGDRALTADPVGEARTQRCAVVTVVDNGVGIPAKIQHRVFEPFFTTRSLAESAGMGLAIADAIVKRQGGRISFRSVQEHGSTFEVALPVLADSDAPVDRTGGGEPLMIIERAPYAAASGREILQELGYSVSAFDSAKQAAAAFEHQRPRLVIVSSQPTEGDGYALARYLRSRDAKVPIILLLDIREEADPELAEELGIAAVLRRPVLVGELALLVKRILTPAPGFEPSGA